jgi:glycerol-3-phosphate dehydrogenase (NAD(P)+)
LHNNSVNLWLRNENLCSLIQRTRVNREYLPGVVLPDNVEVSADIEFSAIEQDIIICAVPSHAVGQVMEKVLSYADNSCIILSVTKGIEQGSLLTMSEILEDILQEKGKECKVAVLSGPSFAREVAEGLFTAVTVASKCLETRNSVQKIFNSQNFRVYTTQDVVGVEIGGATKNVIAIASGVCQGLGFGDNAQAALFSRGLAEIGRLAVRCGAQEQTLFGLSGMGDLKLTCSGEQSRNRQLGIKIGQVGYSYGIMPSTSMVVEGVNTAKSVYNMANMLDVDMPISEQVYEVLYNGKNAREAITDLLSRDVGLEY